MERMEVPGQLWHPLVLRPTIAPEKRNLLCAVDSVATLPLCSHTRLGFQSVGVHPGDLLDLLTVPRISVTPARSP